MATYLIIGASLVAILALFVFNVWLMGWTKGVIASLEEAGERLSQDNIGFEPGKGVLSADARAALIADRDSPRTGLVIVHGGGVTTRLLSPGEVRSVEIADDHVIVVKLTDFTLPKVSLKMDNREAALEWAERLKGAPDKADA